MKRVYSKIVGIVICLLAIVSIFYIRKITTLPIFKNDVSSESVEPVQSKQPFNVLLIGSDASGKIADAIMLININESEGKISLLSIPRDTKIYVNGKYRKINSSYVQGADSLIDSVKQLTGVTINYYAAIEPGTLGAIVDSLGGVEYTVEKDMHYSDPAQDLYIDLKKGTQMLNGQQAEQYCRYRQYVMGDYERTQAQQRFFKALFEQKLNTKNITKIYSLYNTLEGKLQTNVTISDIIKNIGIVKMLKDGAQIQCYDCPGEFNDMKRDGISYYIIENKDLNNLRNLCIEEFKIN